MSLSPSSLRVGAGGLRRSLAWSSVWVSDAASGSRNLATSKRRGISGLLVSGHAADLPARQAPGSSRSFASSPACRAEATSGSSSSAPAASSNRSVLARLQSRHLLQSATSSALDGHLSEGVKRTIYAGVDPSADSLHLGNLLPLLALLHLAEEGHRVIVVIGGATGSIGDPSGRSTERTALSPSELAHNVSHITAQVHRFFARVQEYRGRRSKEGGAKVPEIDFAVVNNADWYQGMGVLEFLRDVGKYARISTMLARDSVKTRLVAAPGSSQPPPGLSFTEFSYSLLQGYDFYVLSKAPWGCTVQLGGSDQMGNIMAGVDLIRRIRAHEGASAGAPGASESLQALDSAHADEDASTNSAPAPAYGITLPLLTTSGGQKFGKSAGNAIWLGEEKCSHLDMFQYLLRLPDDEVGRYLVALTLMEPEDIDETMRRHGANPAARIAQRRLAEEVTELVRGRAGLRQAVTATDILFGGRDIREISPCDVKEAFESQATGSDNSKSGARFVRLKREEAVGRSLVDLAHAAGLGKSKGDIRRLVKAGGVSVNNSALPANEASPRFTEDMIISSPSGGEEGSFALLRVGKSGYCVLWIE